MEREWDWKGVLDYNCDSHMIWLWLTEQKDEGWQFREKQHCIWREIEKEQD